MLYDKIFDSKKRCLWEDRYIIGRLKEVAGKVPSPPRVLDIASGTGRFPSKVFGESYVAVDIDEEMLAQNPAATKHVGDYSLIKNWTSDIFELTTFFFGNVKDTAHLREIFTDTSHLLVEDGKFFGVIYSKGRKDSFVYPSLYEWGDFAMFSPKDIREASEGNYKNVRITGITASVWDIIEKLPSFEVLANSYVKSGYGWSGIKWLRWHYLVVEATKL